jgi:uncharacterized protein (TIGR02145 family)
MKNQLLYIILMLSIFCFYFFTCCSNNSNNPSAQKIDTVAIGTQVWMKKNLDVDHYRNGDPIPHITNSTDWKNLKSGAWCYYEDNPAYGAIYGKLYNWYAVNDTRGLAPMGWHIPSYKEWTTLLIYLGDENIAGGKLKESGTSHWEIPNKGATNESKFSALPGGFCDSGISLLIGYYGYWWSSTEYDSSKADFRCLFFNGIDIGRGSSEKQKGYSVRCVRD